MNNPHSEEALRIQFFIEEQRDSDAIERIVGGLRRAVVDRRVSPSSAARFIVEAVLRQDGLAETLLGLKDEPITVRPGTRVKKDDQGNFYLLHVR